MSRSYWERLCDRLVHTCFAGQFLCNINNGGSLHYLFHPRTDRQCHNRMSDWLWHLFLLADLVAKQPRFTSTLTEQLPHGNGELWRSQRACPASWGALSMPEYMETFSVGISVTEKKKPKKEWQGGTAKEGKDRKVLPLLLWKRENRSMGGWQDVWEWVGNVWG